MDTHHTPHTVHVHTSHTPHINTHTIHHTHTHYTHTHTHHTPHMHTNITHIHTTHTSYIHITPHTHTHTHTVPLVCNFTALGNLRDPAVTHPQEKGPQLWPECFPDKNRLLVSFNSANKSGNAACGPHSERQPSRGEEGAEGCRQCQGRMKPHALSPCPHALT